MPSGRRGFNSPDGYSYLFHIRGVRTPLFLHGKSVLSRKKKKWSRFFVILPHVFRKLWIRVW